MTPFCHFLKPNSCWHRPLFHIFKYTVDFQGIYVKSQIFNFMTHSLWALFFFLICAISDLFGLFLIVCFQRLTSLVKYASWVSILNRIVIEGSGKRLPWIASSPYNCLRDHPCWRVAMTYWRSFQEDAWAPFFTVTSLGSHKVSFYLVIKW